MIVLLVGRKRRIQVLHSLRVGRDPVWSDLALEPAEISRHHLEIIPETAGYRAWDIGSQNGTTVNGEPVGSTGRSLAEGDLIELGGVFKLLVSTLTPPRDSPTTTLGGRAIHLLIQRQKNQFVVEFWHRGRTIRDAMPAQIGRALSLLSLYQRDGLGPVPDQDLRAIAWQGDERAQKTADINRLIARVRRWFDSRGVPAPELVRPRSAGTTQLQMAPTTLHIDPDDWLYRFLEGD